MRALMQAGARVIALGAGGDGYERRLRAAGIDYRPIPVARRSLNPGADFALLLALVAVMRRERPSVVHCFTIKPAIFGTIAARLCGVPARVVTITGLGYAFTSAGTLLNGVVSSLYRLALAGAHLVCFQNREDRDIFVKRGLVAQSKAELTVGTGIDVQRFAATALPIELRAGAPRFLMIARLIREKGVHEFLLAAAAVKHRYSDVEFSLLGAEDPRNPSALDAAQMEDLRASQTVRWLGETHDVRGYIAAADAVVLPSYREGLPRVLIEAGAMGRAAVATDVAGCRDVVVHGVTGLLVPPMNAAALAEALCRLVQRPHELVAMGAAARVRVVANFDEQAVIAILLATYRRLLAAARGTDAGTAATA
ncbi:MAG TPA: glycosyltransferase family 4 protein [Steroidobacteraceae bacterium]|nr:glycosyltransferase family 4 protein [Steroidobacteraceae bacterium]